MPNTIAAKPDDLGQVIEAAVERIIRDFVHSELVRQQERGFALVRSRYFGVQDRTRLATANSGAYQAALKRGVQ